MNSFIRFFPTNRKRGELIQMREIKIRMQEEEADAVKRKAKEAGMSQSAYIRKLIESGDGSIRSVKTEDLTDLMNLYTCMCEGVEILAELVRNGRLGIRTKTEAEIEMLIFKRKLNEIEKMVKEIVSAEYKKIAREQ
ncbi:MAG: ribbon-helix-helix protein, CopG family [Lachnospiraceae bacterium]|nr:ribbon-helix-helix protein, CopG family [Lachnospiraceae bacterium]